MPRYKIAVEDASVSIRAKVFEAGSLEDAKEQAEAEEWDEANGWEEIDSSTNCEIRDDLSQKTTE